NEIDAKYLFYYLQSSKAKEYVAESKAGSTQQYLTLNSLKMFPVPVFEFEYKYHIVDTTC
ncbi:MAG: restriction endonuclease subunit S, partial [Clostridia bacterium]|nr:restriction endonuclease subunit S [Clostridia bacterium]